MDQSNFPNFPSQQSFPPPGYPPHDYQQNYQQQNYQTQKDHTLPVVIGVLCGCGCLSFVVIGILIALLLPAVQAAREAARRMQCVNMEKQILIAFHNYHDKHGVFPPAYLPDANGKPLHSWRVLILPYIEQPHLHELIRLDEPWDSTHNSQFHSMMPSIYLCPSAAVPENKKRGWTSYKMVVGKNTISDGPNGIKLSEITNGTSNVAGIVEVIPSSNWMDPTQEIPFDELNKGFNWSKTEGIGSRHIGGANLAFMDGSVKFIANSIDTNTLEQICRAFTGERRAVMPGRPRSLEEARARSEAMRERMEQRMRTNTRPRFNETPGNVPARKPGVAPDAKPTDKKNNDDWGL